MCYTADFSHSCCHASTYDKEFARLESKRDIVHEKKVRIRGGHGVIGRNVDSIPEHMYFLFWKNEIMDTKQHRTHESACTENVLKYDCYKRINPEMIN